MKNKAFGHLKTRLCTIKPSKKVGFWGPRVGSIFDPQKKTAENLITACRPRCLAEMLVNQFVRLSGLNDMVVMSSSSKGETKPGRLLGCKKQWIHWKFMYPKVIIQIIYDFSVSVSFFCILKWITKIPPRGGRKTMKNWGLGRLNL